MISLPIPDFCKKLLDKTDVLTASYDNKQEKNALNDKAYKNDKLVNPNDIEVDPEFSSVFKINDKTLEMIKLSMQINGYDYSQPIVVIIRNDKYVVIEGHSRLRAAKEVQIESIPVFIVEKSRDEILHYILKRQAQRRNLTQGEILHAVKLIVNKQHRDGSGRSSKILSDELGISESTIVHAIAVSKNADTESIQAIEDDKVSINSVYQKMRKKKQIKEEAVSDEKIPLQNNTTIKDTSSSCIEDVNVFTPATESQDVSLISTSVSIEDILRLLMENNEKNAINIILQKYRNLISNQCLIEFGS